MTDKAQTEALAKILRGVRGAFAEGPVDRIEIRHMHAGGEEARVSSAFTGDKISGKGVTSDQIADELIESIADDAKMFPGVANYAVLFYKPGEREYSRRVVVQLRGKADRLSNSIETSEAANEKGLVAMSMRFAQDLFRQALAGTELVHRENTQLRAQIDQYHAREFEVKKVGEELLDRQYERENQRRRAQIMEKGFLSVMGKYGPHLAHKLFPDAMPPPRQLASSNGTAKTPSAPSLDELEKLGAQDLSTVIFSLTKIEIEKLREAFRDEPRAAFDVLFGKVSARRDGEASDRDVVEAALRWAPLLSLEEQGALLAAVENKPTSVLEAMRECNDALDAYVKQRTEQGDRT